jgi:hypothetical protein
MANCLVMINDFYALFHSSIYNYNFPSDVVLNTKLLKPLQIEHSRDTAKIKTI